MKNILLMLFLCIGSLSANNLERGMQAYNKDNFTKAYKLLLPIARSSDNAKVHYSIGYMYYYGEGVNKDYKKALYWFKKAASKNHSGAQQKLGYMYFSGAALKKDLKLATYWFKLSAKNGYSVGQENIASCYRYGIGVEKNYKKALYWYEKAANSGRLKAQRYLGDMYYDGTGVEKNYKKAFYLYEKAAQKGDAYSQYQLGIMYYNSRGVNKNYEKAFYWFEKAAKQGDKFAENNLGHMYAEGLSVKQNIPKFMYWAKKAVLHGNKKSEGGFYYQARNYEFTKKFAHLCFEDYPDYVKNATFSHNNYTNAKSKTDGYIDYCMYNTDIDYPPYIKKVLPKESKLQALKFTTNKIEQNLNINIKEVAKRALVTIEYKNEKMINDGLEFSIDESNSELYSFIENYSKGLSNKCFTLHGDKIHDQDFEDSVFKALYGAKALRKLNREEKNRKTHTIDLDKYLDQINSFADLMIYESRKDKMRPNEEYISTLLNEIKKDYDDNVFDDVTRFRIYKLVTYIETLIKAKETFFTSVSINAVKSYAKRTGQNDDYVDQFMKLKNTNMEDEVQDTLHALYKSAGGF